MALSAESANVAWLALAEARVRGLAAAEEYRVIADRLYQSGVRDLPSGALIEWIEATVASEYEELLRLRSLGEQLARAVATGDLARVAWQLGSELDTDSRRRLIDGLEHIDRLESGADETN